MNKVIAIPAEKLGLLEQQFIGLISPVLKRKRQVRFNGLVQVLKALGLIRMKSEVVALSYGIEANGALTAFIICDIDQRVGGESLASIYFSEENVQHMEPLASAAGEAQS